MHRMTYSSVHLCNPPEAISDGRLNPATDTSLLLAAYRGGSHLTSDIQKRNIRPVMVLIFLFLYIRHSCVILQNRLLLFRQSERTLQCHDTVKYRCPFFGVFGICTEITLTYKLEAFVWFCLCKCRLYEAFFYGQ